MSPTFTETVCLHSKMFVHNTRIHNYWRTLFQWNGVPVLMRFPSLKCRHLNLYIFRITVWYTTLVMMGVKNRSTLNLHPGVITEIRVHSVTIKTTVVSRNKAVHEEQTCPNTLPIIYRPVPLKSLFTVKQIIFIKQSYWREFHNWGKTFQVYVKQDKSQNPKAYISDVIWVSPTENFGSVLVNDQLDAQILSYIYAFSKFYILLTVRLGIRQLDPQILSYIYIYIYIFIRKNLCVKLVFYQNYT